MKSLLTILLLSLLYLSGQAQYLKNLKFDNYYSVKSISDGETTCSEYTEGAPPLFKLCTRLGKTGICLSSTYFCHVNIPFEIAYIRLNLNEYKVLGNRIIYDLDQVNMDINGGKLSIKISRGSALVTFTLTIYKYSTINPDKIYKTYIINGVFGKEASDLIKK